MSNTYTCDKFESLGAFVDYLERETAGRYCKTVTDAVNANFHGRNGTWDNAIKWAREGDNRNLDKFADLTRQARDKIARHVERRFSPAFSRTGSGSISMGRYMEGRPDCVVRMKPGREELRKGGGQQRVIKLFVGLSASWNIHPDEIEKRGAYICGIVEALAAAGRQVELWGGALSRTYYGEAQIMEMICIKKASERLHIETARFALCNPVMNRRLLFTYIELHEAEFRETYESIPNKAIAASWGVPMAENAAAAEFTVLYPFQGDGDSNRHGVNSADYHTQKIEERLKEAGILQ